VACILIYKGYAEFIVPIKCCAEAQKIPKNITPVWQGGNLLPR